MVKWTVKVKVGRGWRTLWTFTTEGAAARYLWECQQANPGREYRMVKR